ncbi:MBL fold metallo-hydrolase [Mycolicibacterium litorale]|nr:MBL fold metallo-hydrolase [Mycolicibacterium litorale]
MTDVPETYVAGATDPAVSGRPVEVSDGVFIIGDNRIPFVPNVGIVVGADAALVIDTGIGPDNGRIVLDHARRLAGRRRLYLTVTQFDPGHGFGVQAFKDAATVIYSDAQRDRLRLDADSFVPTFRSLSPDVAARLEGLDLIDCDISFGRRLDIDLGGITATLRQWGPAHTRDNQTVHVGQRVLFTGDLCETRMFPILPYFPPFDKYFDGRRWIDALDRLIAERPDIVVPGHGEVTDVQQLVAVRDYLRYVGELTRLLWLDDVPAQEISTVVAQQARTIWPGWDGPRNIRYAARAFYEQFEREK